MLPESITTQTVREASDEVDVQSNYRWLELMHNEMEAYINATIEVLAKKHNLTDEQVEELEERIGWGLRFLPD